MTDPAIQQLVVCGAGTMGRGIAETAALHGIPVLLYDLLPEGVEKAGRLIREDIQKQVQKKILDPAEAEVAMSRIRFSSDINDCIGDILIEAIHENEAAKIGLLSQLAERNHSDAVFASNTSSLSISAMAEKIPNPERVAGMHFFNPANRMKLVELVRGRKTRDSVISRLQNLARMMNKTAVLCNDEPGFIVNHVARPYYLESLRLLEKHKTDLETIDSLLEATGFPMGPFRLMDLIGNDINYAVSVSVYDQLGRPLRLEPSPIQKEKVEKKELGRKTGKGYYTYPSR